MSLIGEPNAGKSSLINSFVGEKIAIVTHKAQTTRMSLRGIVIRGSSQIIFMDTPGIFKANRFLERIMVKSAWKSSNDSNVTCLIYDATKTEINENTSKILHSLNKFNNPVILVLNKVDLIRRKTLLPLIDRFNNIANFNKVFMVSALNGDGTEDLLNWLSEQMPEGPFLYDDDDISDMPIRQMASEILREKLILNLHQEIPYNLIVETESWETRDDKSVKICQNIYVSRKSHKSIVIGNSGNNIKLIGTIARKEMQSIFNFKVHLFIRVKVREDCLTDTKLLQSIGIDTNA